MKKSVALFLSSAAALAILSAGAWVVYTYPPAEHRFYPRCVFKAVTGIDCPGCGATRAVHHLLHGRAGEALRMNPLIFFMGGIVLCMLPSLARGRQPRFLSQPWFGWLMVIVVMGWWILRNTVMRVS